MNTHYITSALPYVNGPPHLGHALELVLTDALARWHRSAGRDVRYVTGSDENSLKNVQAAERAGVSVRELVDRNAAEFPRLAVALGVHIDDFVRTSVDPRHRATTEKLWKACVDRGDVYKKKYRGLYCVGCEQFYAESELEAGCCPEHGTPPEVVEEENWFFRLSRYQEPLRELIARDALRVTPVERKNEVLRFVERGLEDFSISRSRERARGWGIAVPNDPSQVVYVWFDALGNYLAALGHAQASDAFERWWLRCPAREHVIGKGITRFHAVYWPAILLSAGLPLPTRVLVHGYVTVEGAKIGKSLGNALDPFQLCDEYGSDALRYYLLRHLSTTKDGNFERARLSQAHDSELANQLGNLLQRSLRLVEKRADGVVPKAESALGAALSAAVSETARAVEAFDLRGALDAAWRFVAEVNRYADETAPWQGERDDTALYTLLDGAGAAAALLQPFLPKTAERIAERLGPRSVGAGARVGELRAGRRVSAGAPLFPRRVVASRR